jgi:hypothetical protein
LLLALILKRESDLMELTGEQLRSRLGDMLSFKTIAADLECLPPAPWLSADLSDGGDSSLRLAVPSGPQELLTKVGLGCFVWRFAECGIHSMEQLCDEGLTDAQLRDVIGLETDQIVTFRSAVNQFRLAVGALDEEAEKAATASITSRPRRLSSQGSGAESTPHHKSLVSQWCMEANELYRSTPVSYRQQLPQIDEIALTAGADEEASSPVDDVSASIHSHPFCLSVKASELVPQLCLGRIHMLHEDRAELMNVSSMQYFTREARGPVRFYAVRVCSCHRRRACLMCRVARMSGGLPFRRCG